MTFVQIVDIILTIVILILGAYGAYKSTGKTIQEKLSYLISKAAELDIIGAEKMKSVVAALYSYVPVVFRPYLTKEKLQQTAQKVYDDMKEFAKIESEEINIK